MATTNAEWMTSNGNYGLAYFHAGIHKTNAEQITAGLSRAERAYHEFGHCYPRFERQKIRALLDENILSGTKQPDPGLLSRIPMVPRVDPEERPHSSSSKAPSVRSNRSQRSAAASNRSQRSQRSQASGRAGSAVVSSRAGAPSASFMRTETHGRPAFFGRDHYGTFNSLYGAKVHEKMPLPDKGRESWMLGRGGGQVTTFDNCLHRESRTYVPEIRSEPML